MPKRGSIRGQSTYNPNEPHTIESACETVAGALWDAIDLLLIHNEGPTGGEAPRGVLNPLVVLLAVSAWERFVYELAQATGISLGERETVGGFDCKQLKKTLEILRAASNGTLPNGFNVTVYDHTYSILRKRDQLEIGKDKQAFLEEFNSYVELRNGVAHRVVPQRMTAEDLRSDAATVVEGNWQGLTINTSVARMIMAAYIQLVDQAIVHVCEAQGIGPENLSRLRLPGFWFTDDHVATNSHRTWQPGCLWEGTVLPRTP